MPPIKPGIYQKEITFSSVTEIIFLFTQLYSKDNKMSLRFSLQNSLYELKNKIFKLVNVTGKKLEIMNINKWW